jgi:hypothetical protein
VRTRPDPLVKTFFIFKKLVSLRMATRGYFLKKYHIRNENIFDLRKALPCLVKPAIMLQNKSLGQVPTIGTMSHDMFPY